MALIIVSARPAHFFGPGKNSHSLEQLAGPAPEQGLDQARVAESLIKAQDYIPPQEIPAADAGSKPDRRNRRPITGV